MKSFAERLRHLMDAKKMNQQAVADGIQVNRARISLWLNEKVTDPRRATLQKLADFFGCNIEWLATGTGPMFPDETNQKVKKMVASERALRNYTEIAALDSETLGEIQTWLNEQEKLNPGFTTWFRVEFVKRFPEFESWKEKIIKTEASG